MPVTENPLAFTWTNPEPKRLLYLLEREDHIVAYEEGRKALQLLATPYHRVTRRLAQLDLVRLRAPKGAEFDDNNRIRLVMELSPQGRSMLKVLHKLDSVAANAKGIGAAAEDLLVDA